MLKEISEAVNKRRGQAISLLQDLIKAPSPSGNEAEAAEAVAEGMRATGFDIVRVDGLCDALGTVKGSGGGRSILFNGHIDHVPPGGMVDPYSGRLMDGAQFGVEGEVVYGRAASDMKGAVAAMVTAGGILNELGVELRGDFKVAGVAREEIGGAGTISTILDSHFLGDVVIIGEATNMDVALGHRGHVRTDIVVKGRSCHASAPDRGINALYKASDLISKIRSELTPRLPEHPIMGGTSLAVTKISVKPDTSNVVPEECSFHIDCRNTPNYPAEDLQRDLNELVASVKAEDPEFEAIVLPSQLIRGDRSFSGFYTDPKTHPVVHEVKQAVSEALDREPKIKVWTFSTDGRFYSWMGLPVVGFGPGEERFAHTHQDHVRVEDYIQAVKTYAWLACKICGVE
jgi:putative selenium metabolism hydrolase